MEKIVAQLPGFHTVSLGPLQIRTGGSDPSEMREALESLICSAQRMLDLFEAAQRTPQTPVTRRPAVRRARRGTRVDERES